MDSIRDFLCSVRMTVVSGIFLAASLILSLADINIGFDPAWVTVVISGLPLLYLAIKRIIVNKGISKISSALLISIAMIAAIIIGDLFAAGEVAFIMAIGEILEDKTTEKAKRGLRKLISLSPVHGRVVENGEERTVPCDKIKKGDTVRILPGETIPVDGEIISGDTSVDQSVMTGESLPVDKTVGDSVFSGTVNRFGAVDVRASRVGSDSSISKLIRMVKEAEEKKAPMQRSADKWASFLVPVALVIAIAAYIITKDPVRAVTVLVVFCPCALVLSTPTAIMAAIGQATKKGIIIKSGEALENMGKAQAIAFDKTGTLTYGKPDVSDVFVCGNMSEQDLVSLCAAAEVRSEHPLAKAITDYAQKNDIAFSQPADFSMCAGKGVAVTTERGKVICGNERYIVESGVDIDENALEALEKFHADGKASIVVACDGECMGIIALSDKMKPEVPEMTKRLVEMGIIPVLLTGDNVRAAEFMANKTGIGSVYAELLPGDKVEAVQKLGERGGAVCMVGDGINDAPALKCADVGIAMGAMGSDIAVEAADIAIMSDDISKVTYIRRLSLETLKTIRFSISLSLFINFAAIILSFFGIIGPTAGALIHNAGSCFVVLIAAMLYDKKIDG
ncbi:MAG: cation-translocating P-type ATPase [Clostridia bacterium]|nr:cation-translocating P-type ATPase [Clostridia bacterium]